MLVEVDTGAVINLDKLVAAGLASSAPVRRLLRAAGEGRVIDLTYGGPRQTMLVMDSGHLILLAVPPATVRDCSDGPR